VFVALLAWVYDDLMVGFDVGAADIKALPLLLVAILREAEELLCLLMLSLLLLLGISMGLQPPKKSKIIATPCRFRHPSFDVPVERQLSSERRTRSTNAVSMHLQARAKEGVRPTPEMMETNGRFIEQSAK
jgi:hypothetical protein